MSIKIFLKSRSQIFCFYTDGIINACKIFACKWPTSCLLLPYLLLPCLSFFKALQGNMEVQSGVKQPEPRALGSPRSGANQQNEFDDRQPDDSGRTSTDNHSKDVLPASQTDDKKVSCGLQLLHICSCCTSAAVVLCCACACVWLGVSECVCAISDETLPVYVAILGDMSCSSART